jgi:beta-lactamase superfamily II metal-dependent hydrolase
MTFWAALLLAAVTAADTPAVHITFLDVGQGDATLIESPAGKRALVDGGRGTWAVTEMLKAMGVDTLDLVVATHADVDHIGGLDGVLLQLPVRSYLDNGRPHTTSAYRELMDVVEWSGVTYLAPVARTIALDSVTLRVLPPWPEARDQNNASVGLLLEYGAFRALLVGDAEQDALNHFLRLGVPTVSVLKASHHGARNGVTPGWVQATKPRIVVISVGARNAYGHPDPYALRYYGLYAEAIYRTDRDGGIVVSGRRDGSFTVTTRDEAGNPVTLTFPHLEKP